MSTYVAQRMHFKWRRASLCVMLLCVSACQKRVVHESARASPTDWPVYGGNSQAQRYSPLTQIDRNNVSRLQEVWRFSSPELGDPETNPLILAGVLYAYTPTLKVLALNAATGKQLWKFDPGIHTGQPSRGLTIWSDGTTQRLFAGVMNYLYALDPATGQPVTSFGKEGRIDLRQGLLGDSSKHFVALTSPGIVYKDLIIVGFRTMETHPAPPGDIRAYDVRTGEVRWTYHTIPRPGEAGVETWPADAWKNAGSANNWAGMALDENRGIVYIPTGSAVSDFYGADRIGNDLYADTLLALDAGSGRKLWHFQEIHHDILDRDLPTAPSLLTITRQGRKVDVVAQPTKQGFLFVLDRETGRPVFPVEERAAPRSEVPGELASPTQPYPVIPEPYARQHLTEDLLTSRTPAARAWAVEQFRGFRSEGPFTPAGVERPSVVFPGFDGGAEWGGAAVDPQRGVIYLNANDVAWTAQLSDKVAQSGIAVQVYEGLCAACHGADRKGSPPAFPSLLDLQQRVTAADIEQVITDGRGRMPAFDMLSKPILDALVEYVRTGKEQALKDKPDTFGSAKEKEMSFPVGIQDAGARYHFTGYKKFLDPDGYPAVAPPWGTLNAIDLNTGKYLWKIPLGEYPELAAQGLHNTGTENYGGPVVTAGGLVFIGATIFDKKLRAFDAATGRLLWETQLPFAGTATPATYMVGGRQYLVIESNNARDRKAPQGMSYVAFALP
jgi:quinoprotein glucose dehydrogenase